LSEIINKTKSNNNKFINDNLFKNKSEGEIKTNRVVGTPNYIAPEVLNETVTDLQAVDWWSLGCLFFEFLTGEKAFDGDTVEECFENI